MIAYTHRTQGVKKGLDATFPRSVERAVAEDTQRIPYPTRVTYALMRGLSTAGYHIACAVMRCPLAKGDLYTKKVTSLPNLAPLQVVVGKELYKA